MHTRICNMHVIYALERGEGEREKERKRKRKTQNLE